MSDLLKAIWMRVLQVESVSPEDDFFAMGGDFKKARQLFLEISSALDREVPPVTVFRAPTFAEMTGLLAPGNQPRHFSHIVPMRSGDLARPIFLAPGLGSDILELLDFANALSDPGCVFGFFPQHPDETAAPLSSVESMADFYMEGLKHIQPRGPYRLIGYSFGGLVVFEIACRMAERGDTIDFLGLIETYPYRDQLGLPQRLDVYFRLLKRHRAILAGLPLKTKLQYLAHGSVRQRYTSLDDEGNPQGIARPKPTNEADVLRKERETKALSSYKPRIYPGKIHYVRGAKPNSSFPSNPKKVWSQWCRDIDEAIVPGDHFEIITTNFDQLAAVMSHNLAAASQDNHEIGVEEGKDLLSERR
jgi:thioesterase domain-containing protein